MFDNYTIAERMLFEQQARMAEHSKRSAEISAQRFAEADARKAAEREQAMTVGSVSFGPVYELKQHKKGKLEHFLDGCADAVRFIVICGVLLFFLMILAAIFA